MSEYYVQAQIRVYAGSAAGAADEAQAFIDRIHADQALLSPLTLYRHIIELERDGDDEYIVLEDTPL